MAAKRGADSCVSNQLCGPLATIRNEVAACSAEISMRRQSHNNTCHVNSSEDSTLCKNSNAPANNSDCRNFLLLVGMTGIEPALRLRN